MSIDRPTLLQAARQGEIDAIVELIQAQIKIPALTVKIGRQTAGYKLRLEGAVMPDQSRSSQFINSLFSEIQRPQATRVDVYGWLQDDDFPAWHTTLDIPAGAASDAAVTSDRKASGETRTATADSTSAAAASADSPDEPAVEPSQSRFQSVLGAVGTAASAVGQVASQGGEVVSDAVTDTAQTLSSAAVRTGGKVVRTSVDAWGAIGQTAANVPQGLSDLVQAVNQNAELQSLTKVLQVDWLLQILDQVDVAKAAQQVQQLQEQYPEDTPARLSRRIMTRKALYVGGTGLASSLLPGFAAAMVAVDLAATTAVQAEMGYQIAYAYGFDVHDEDRQGEILTIFGLAFGSNQVLKTGLTYLARGIPIAGAAVGASTNAVALYAVGHAAAQYYEAKQAAPDDTVAIADLSQADQVAGWTTQQMVMDQILTHVVVAGYPETDWETLWPQLATLNLSPASLKVIQQEIDSPADLDQLLDQLNNEFAVFLLAQCERLTELDGVVTAEEQTVLEIILAKLSDRLPQNTPAETTAIAQSLRDRLQS
ncbi:MAG: EcsC family protein [Leptolyngbyaceae cyanobacterium]